MTRRMWVAVAIVTVMLLGGTAFVVGQALRSAEPPRADLLQPEPQPSSGLPITRWPLGAPANREVPCCPTWSTV